MMNILLKHLSRMVLTPATCEAFLYRAAKLVIIRELSMDDWVYLAHLMVYKTTTRCNATDEEKEMLAKELRGIVSEQRRRESMYN